MTLYTSKYTASAVALAISCGVFNLTFANPISPVTDDSPPSVVQSVRNSNSNLLKDDVDQGDERTTWTDVPPDALRFMLSKLTDEEFESCAKVDIHLKDAPFDVAFYQRLAFLKSVGAEDSPTFGGFISECRREYKPENAVDTLSKLTDLYVPLKQGMTLQDLELMHITLLSNGTVRNFESHRTILRNSQVLNNIASINTLVRLNSLPYIPEVIEELFKLPTDQITPRLEAIDAQGEVFGDDFHGISLRQAVQLPADQIKRRGSVLLKHAETFFIKEHSGKELHLHGWDVGSYLPHRYRIIAQALKLDEGQIEDRAQLIQAYAKALFGSYIYPLKRMAIIEEILKLDASGLENLKKSPARFLDSIESKTPFYG